MKCRMPGAPKHFHDRESAERALSLIWAKPIPGRLPVKSYQCPWCEHWHLSKGDPAPMARPVTSLSHPMNGLLDARI